MDLDEIVQVKEIHSGYSVQSASITTEKINSLLNEGWRILKMYTTCYDEELFPNQQEVHYVLGITESQIRHIGINKKYDFSNL